MKTIIIGGVAGGATTAARLRRKDENMQIIMLEKGDYISYANCGLPYYIGDKIKSREALLLQTPEAMKEKFKIDVRTANEVTQILPDEKKVIVKQVKTGETYEESYDYLVIATGSSPIRPNIKGIDASNIFTLWSVPDTDVIKEFVTKKHPKTAAVIGGGFIGLEMAENLHAAGVKVSLIEMQDQVMAPLDFEMANLLHENMRMNGVQLVLGDGVSAFEKIVDITPEENGGCGQKESTRIRLNSGKQLDADMVVLSIGVRPNSGLAKDAGLELGAKGGIVVNDGLRTSKSDIFAVGDVIEVKHYVTGEKTMIPLAGPANRQARILADNIAALAAAKNGTDENTAVIAAAKAEEKSYKGSLGTAVAKVFDLNAASVGLNEKQLRSMGKEKNKDYFTVLINQKSHAGYYPGATPITLKMLFDGKGTIFGGQIVGQDGVDKRIDTLASVMRLKGTIYDLAELELSYAPPFSSAKDPVNMLGFVAENVIKGIVSFTEWKELDEILADPQKAAQVTVLDVTEDMERMVFSIPGSYHIPLGQLRKRMQELDTHKKIITYCAIGVRAYNAARILMQHGYQDVAVLSGGTSFYKSMHHEEQMAGMCGTKAGNPTVSGSGNIQKIGSEEKAVTNTKHEANEVSAAELQQMKILDCTGLQCPGPIMKVHETLRGMQNQEILQVSATDMGFARDIEAWCRRTGNTLVKTERKERENIVYIKKGKTESRESAMQNALQAGTERAGGKTMVVFSGDLDKVLASFIIANGAAAMGRPVTMFFTFWGLNALRKPEGAKVKKTLIEKMFGKMMPKGSTKLKLSKMNMAGMGTAMMKKVMQDKNVDSLETLIAHARKNGVKLVACTMSMDVMGIKKEELIDGIEYAGVASYLGDAEESDVNLFIS